MNRSIVVAAALFAACALPAAAASSLTVPLVASAPSPTGAFPAGAVATLDWNATEQRRADEPAIAHAVSDGTNLYVRFDVSQREPMIGNAGGDNVVVDLWPDGPSGSEYRFGVDLDGTYTADSTANTADWGATTSTHAGGYTVTMRIPLAAIRGSNSQVQFERWIASTGELQLWSHGNGSDAVAQAGSIAFASSVGAAPAPGAP